MQTGRFFRNAFFLCFLICGCTGLFAQNRQAVMVKGNTWINENPGFGIETVTSLYGEYRIEIQDNGIYKNQYTFSVRVCGEGSLLTVDGWQNRPGSASMLQRRENSGLLIAYPFFGGADLGTWTVIFCFPLSPEADSQPLPGLIDDAGIYLLINAWTERFRYFFSLVRVASDMSLPAVVSF